MSRHTISLGERREIAIGWDGPDNSYFAQVFEYADDGKKEYLLDVGGIQMNDDGFPFRDRIGSVDELADRVSEYYKITSEDIRNLTMDRLSRGDELTPLQKWVTRKFDKALDLSPDPRAED